jgi:cyclopropane fatty-acyl-phospholipid synthase-like methyltransferase
MRVLDVGCRDAWYLIRLAERFGVTGLGIDPVPWHIERAASAIAQADLEQQLSTELVGIENFGGKPGSFDVVWCRDVLEVLPDLPVALSTMSRVLAPGGTVIAYTNVLNGPPDPSETRRLHEPLGVFTANLVEAGLESAFARHGFTVTEKHVIGTQWREHVEERDHDVSRDLLRLARLRRSRDRVEAEYGEETYRLFEASTQWQLQQFLGRLAPVVYILSKA